MATPIDPLALITAARTAMANAHAPYSRFAVGAAVLLIDGQIITGSNFENASYGLSLCAETVAIAAVNSQGRLADIAAIAVAGGSINAASAAGLTDPVTPCGRCRQVMVEAEQMARRPLILYCASASGKAYVTHRLADLLPHAFGPEALGIMPPAKDV